VPVRDRSSTVIKIGWVFLELGSGQTLKTLSNLQGVKAELANGEKINLLEIVQQYGNEALKQTATQEQGPESLVCRLHDDLRLFRRQLFIGTVRFLFIKWKHKNQYFFIRLKPVRYGDRVLAIGRAKRRGMEWTATAIVEKPGIVRIRCEAPKTLATTLMFAPLPKGLKDFESSNDVLHKNTKKNSSRKRPYA
jgi:hypothetical protein